jgi:hypothetical protein
MPTADATKTNKDLQQCAGDLPLEDTDDYKYFVEYELDKQVDRLMPLEEQVRKQRELEGAIFRNTETSGPNKFSFQTWQDSNSTD